MVHIPTIIIALPWVDLLSGCVRDYFLLGCVVLCLRVAVGVGDCARVVAGLIVVALGIEGKVTLGRPVSIVGSLKVGAVLDVSKVSEELVAAKCDYQIQGIGANTDSNQPFNTQLYCLGEVEPQDHALHYRQY